MQDLAFPTTALITGGSNGIGLAIAQKFSENNINVNIADINDYKGIDSNIKFESCDVSNADQVKRLYDNIMKTSGPPDVLVLNAGRGIREKLTEGDPEKWQKIFDINVMGALRCIRAFVPQMLEREKGHVVIISSVAANQPHPYGGIYSASKSALEVIAETLRLETIPHVNVTVVSPGITDTGFFENEISGNMNKDDFGMGAISAEEIAEDVFYAISKKQGTSINKIITRPIAQSF